MTDPGALDNAGIQLRTAIEDGDYEAAQMLLAAYCSHVEATLKSLGASRVKVSQLAVETNRMFEWAHRRVSIARTEAAAGLQQVRSQRSYIDVRRPGVKTWEIEG